MQKDICLLKGDDFACVEVSGVLGLASFRNYWLISKEYKEDDAEMKNPDRILLCICLLCVFMLLGGCMRKPLPPVVVTLPQHTVDYLAEVKPILDKRCVVCHSCYNSPCQLKLSSYEGVDRGATKKAVYDSGRLDTMDPTRLFVDAVGREQWEEKGFFSVTNSSHKGQLNDSLMLQLLSHKMENPVSHGEYRPEAENLTCSENGSELSSYLQKHPNRGMPFGFPPLLEHEFNIVAGWLAQGAHGPLDYENEALQSISPADIADVEKWEEFLNKKDAKHVMTARYLYEHLFLAHIQFDRESKNFYELVRSRTPSEEKVDVVATVRPYDDPGGEFYYRFRRIHSTIVYKTHMVFTLDEHAYNRYNELFIEPPWQTKPKIMGYGAKESADPFFTFEQIPAKSRYQFLLDNAHYVIMTFIRGPVCKGQVALNVINDHFWILFLDPDADLVVRYPAFLKLHAEKLIMPAEEGSESSILKAIKNPYHDLAMNYHRVRQDFYMSHYFSGMDYNAIWKGNTNNDAPLLTVFRHFDSASVHRGALGRLPKTFWVLDYPLFERIYYSLVAGFDVYGNAWHQLTTRLYMDALRREAEGNFLDFMPRDARDGIMKEWYQGMDFFHVHYHPTAMPSGIHYVSGDPKREFAEHLVEKSFPEELNIHLDPVNYLSEKAKPELPQRLETSKDVFKALNFASGPGEGFFSHVTDHNANVAFIRVKMPLQEDLVISAVVQRWHNNVTFLFGEKKNLDPTRDSADYFPGFIGSYPNYFFVVDLADVSDFAGLLKNYRGSDDDIKKLRKYGVNRSNENFWQVFDWFQERFLQSDPVHAGLFDLNRYYYKAF
jgi:hypothetical protein